MAQPSQVVPTVTMNVPGEPENKQQVNLRDYLNVRVAPFLKKAIHQSLDAEAEFPLQWLGEYLIQQSILHEGNPDRNKIRERFMYEHDVVKREPGATSTATTGIDRNGLTSDNGGGDLDGIPPTQTERVGLSTGTDAEDASLSASVTTSAPAPAVPSVNGVVSTSEEDSVRDTEMGGTS